MRPPVHTQIGSIWIDVAIRQAHAVDADVTDHPVEQGSDISDHIRPRDRVISIDGVVTNTPLRLPGSHVDGATIDPSPITIDAELSVGSAGVIPGVDQAAAILGALRLEVRSRVQYSAQVLRFTSEFDRVTAVHRALTEALQARQLIQIVTALETYDSVALTHYEGVIEGPARKLTFTAEGRVLRVVNSQTVALPAPVAKRALPKRSDGKQSSRAATAAEEAAANSSFAAKLLGLGG